VGVKLFHVDRRTDMTKVTVTLRNFANAPINLKLQLHANSVNRVTINHTQLLETFRTGN